MIRHRLEEAIDGVVSDRLPNRDFLERIADAYESQSTTTTARVDSRTIQQELERIEEKRRRVLEAYFESHIDREERERLLSGIERDKKRYQDLLLQTHQTVRRLSVDELADAFSPFLEWKFLVRQDKRALLRAITPEIHVRDYRVVGMSMITDQPCHDEVNHTFLDRTATRRDLPQRSCTPLSYPRPRPQLPGEVATMLEGLGSASI